MNGRIDLHVHTTASDGSYTPSEVVKMASEINLSAIAITDHDSTEGCQEALSAGEIYNIEVVPGIEISTRWHYAVHILGYYPDPKSSFLVELLQAIVAERDRRNQEICFLMQQDGIPAEYDDLKQRFGSVVGRPHFAQLLAENGMASSIQDAFAQFMEAGRRYYRPRTFVSMDDAITVIRKAGGIPVLAHPFQYRLDDSGLRELIEHATSSGLLGMECFYSGYSKEQCNYLTDRAKEYGLLITGGSDFHGTPKPEISLGSGKGELDVNYSYLQKIKSIRKSVL